MALNLADIALAIGMRRLILILKLIEWFFICLQIPSVGAVNPTVSPSYLNYWKERVLVDLNLQR